MRKKRKRKHKVNNCWRGLYGLIWRLLVVIIVLAIVAFGMLIVFMIVSKSRWSYNPEGDFYMWIKNCQWLYNIAKPFM